MPSTPKSDICDKNLTIIALEPNAIVWPCSGALGVGLRLMSCQWKSCVECVEYDLIEEDHMHFVESRDIDPSKDLQIFAGPFELNSGKTGEDSVSAEAEAYIGCLRQGEVIGIETPVGVPGAWSTPRGGWLSPRV
jgi:hypothetical protein